MLLPADENLSLMTPVRKHFAERFDDARDSGPGFTTFITPSSLR